MSVPLAPGFAACVFLVAALLTAIGTALVRRYSVARAILDVPNHRSSHSTPTPRGGGLAIAAVLLGAIALLLLDGDLDRHLGAALLGGGALVAAVGWADDHGGVRAAYRAVVQLAAAVWGVAWLGGFPTITLGTRVYAPGPAGSVLAVVGVVWCINFYNFMDGIDGIAALNGIVVGAFGALLLSDSGHAYLAVISTIVAGTCAGFLYWNRPPARIFMGDVGSGLLGFVFAMLALASERQAGPAVLLWVLLLGVFVVDATITLARRVLHGERWYDAHRRHAYQRLVQSGRSHLVVTVGVAILDAALGAAALYAARASGRVLPTVVLALVALLLVYAAVERVKPMYDQTDA